MQRSRTEPVDVLIVLMSLVAEGTPQLALQLARQWQREGLRVEVMVFTMLSLTNASYNILKLLNFLFTTKH